MLLTWTCPEYPPHWVNSAIPYGQLKKVLKRVARELTDFGLDPETLRQLLNLDLDVDSPLAVKYGLKGTFIPATIPGNQLD